MIERVISGGQTGADQAGWRAAKRFGIPTGGWMPVGCSTEAGARTEFRTLYGARELERPMTMDLAMEYRERTTLNVQDSDAILLFGDESSPGSRLTIRVAGQTGKELTIIPSPRWTGPWIVSEWLKDDHLRILMVAGNRESKSPGIGAWVESYLCDVFRAMGFKESRPPHLRRGLPQRVVLVAEV